MGNEHYYVVLKKSSLIQRFWVTHFLAYERHQDYLTIIKKRNSIADSTLIARRVVTKANGSSLRRAPTRY